MDSGATVASGSTPVSAACSRVIGPTNPFVRFEVGDTEQSVSTRFEQQVARYGHRLAVRTRNYEWTYEELNASANTIAHALLSEMGANEGQVALLFRHDAPSIAAVLGVLKAGKVYVPMDPSLPAARLSYILQDSQASLILCDTHNQTLARSLANGEMRCLNVDDLPASPSSANLGLEISPDAIAYIVYTSGSTGQPKGVYHDHRGLLHHVLRNTNVQHLCTEDHLSVVASYAFAAWRSDAFGALLNGASLFPFDIKQEGLTQLSRWLQEQEVTVFHCVPTVFRHLAAVLTERDVLSRLRILCLGGEPVYKSDFDLYRRHLPPTCLLLDRFASTEAGFTCHFFADHQSEIEGSTIPAGYPNEGMSVMLLDEDRREVGYNQVGEIAIRSRYLVLGYWWRPDLTAQAFQPGPSGSGERVLHTGDLGLRLSDGCLIPMGRKDFQVKIRGFRVELGEVETTLLNLPGIKEAAVIARAERHQEQTLVAHVVPVPGATCDARQLRDLLARSLPDYLVPLAFVFHEALPLTSTGKVDRRVLAAQEPVEMTPNLDYVAPRDALEKRLVSMWEEALGASPVGVRDDFFMLVDAAGRDLPDGGAALRWLARVVPPAERRCRVPVEALCDVTNPLCGARGAAAVYGPQKGATRDQVQELDLALGVLAERIRETLGLDVADLPGAGAAGGFGAGAIAFLGARLVSGVDAVADLAGLTELLGEADWVVTGEGRFDLQSLQGKVVSGVLRRAALRQARVAVLAGAIDLPRAEWLAAGVQEAEACSPPGMPVDEAMQRAAELLSAAAHRLARRLHGGNHPTAAAAAISRR